MKMKKILKFLRLETAHDQNIGGHYLVIGVIIGLLISIGFSI